MRTVVLVMVTVSTLDKASRNVDGTVSTSVHMVHDHRARWMAKSLKILLFREQFKMNVKKLQVLRRIYHHPVL
jgi:hypothetical protein